MTSSDTQEPRGSRKFAWLTAGIVVAILAYTAGWFYVGGRIERSVDDTVQQAIADGGHATCAGREARGFPFRFGLFCDKVSFSDGPGGVLVEGSGLRTASQVYDPWRIVGELDDVRLRPTAAENGFSASGLDLRFSAVLDDPLPERASLTIKDLSVDAATPEGAAMPVLRMPAAEAHMRRREGDLDLAVEGNGVTLAPPGMEREIGLSRLFLDLTLQDGVALAETPPGSLRGLSVILREATANLTDTAGVTVSGPLSVRPDGLIDAQLEIRVRQAGEIAVSLAEAFPERADEIRTAMAGFAILGEGTPLPLSIDKGRARIAFVKLGRLPPLD